MRPARTDDKGNVLSLVYTDSWGETQYILEMEGLCSRAGCQCIAGGVTCANFHDPFFERSIFRHFYTLCRAGCTCMVVYEGRIFDHVDDPGLRNGPQDLSIGGNIHLIHERGRTPNVRTRDNPHGSPSGGAACLKGEAAGWTLREWRRTKCCSGTTFKALSAQTAYSIYGVAPFSSDIVTNHVTIGVCLEN
ncbi:MAG: hypothetical protein Q9188_003251 [Gyalolechia gomerana]